MVVFRCVAAQASTRMPHRPFGLYSSQRALAKSHNRRSSAPDCRTPLRRVVVWMRLACRARSLTFRCGQAILWPRGAKGAAPPASCCFSGSTPKLSTRQQNVIAAREGKFFYFQWTVRLKGLPSGRLFERCRSTISASPHHAGLGARFWTISSTVQLESYCRRNCPRSELVFASRAARCSAYHFDRLIPAAFQGLVRDADCARGVAPDAIRFAFFASRSFFQPPSLATSLIQIDRADGMDF
jgi:hypothetical protein